jgi:hypothetical protein
MLFDELLNSQLGNSVGHLRPEVIDQFIETLEGKDFYLILWLTQERQNSSYGETENDIYSLEHTADGLSLEFLVIFNENLALYR